MSEKQIHVTIVGGGITGLAAAFYLQKEIEEHRLPLDFTLIEADNRLGGKVQTHYHDGFVIEKGPDSFLARKKSAAELVKDLGMHHDLVRNNTGQSYILHRGQLHPIPEGAIMGIPTKWAPFLRSGLFSPAAKVRAAADLLLPRSKMKKDQSVGQFFRRRLGNEVVDHLIEPLLSGIYAGNLDNLSLMSTFPQFDQLEREYRSLILAMKSTRPPAKQTGKPGGQFLTLKNGLQSLVEAIEQCLPHQSVMKSTTLHHIEKQEEGYRLHVNGDRTLTTNSVILAVPSRIAHKALGNVSYLQPLKETPPTSVANVALAYPEAAVRLEREGTGFVVPRGEDVTITACTWTHKKWPHTTPDGKVLIRCYVGHAGDDRIVDLPDEKIIDAVLSDLKRISNITEKPDFYHITRWKNAMPQYTVGHRTHVEQAKHQLRRQWPGIVLAGAAYEGIGLPDCIDQGKAAVKEILQYVDPKQSDRSIPVMKKFEV